MSNLLERFKKNTKFTDSEWDMLNTDIMNDMSILALVQKYGIKKSYLKEYITHITGMKISDYVRSRESLEKENEQV